MNTLVKRTGQYVLGGVAMLFVAFICLVIYRIPAVMEKEKTAEAIIAIDARRVTLDDVDGIRLPPKPDEALNDKTVAGIDVNGNYIRDDVELAIFNNYPYKPKVRAAQLQYALSQQLFLTDVFNTETWHAVAEKDNRAYQCIGDTYPRTNMEEFIRITDARSDEVKKLVLNTQMRKDAYARAFTFITSFGLGSFEVCDIDLDTL